MHRRSLRTVLLRLTTITALALPTALAAADCPSSGQPGTFAWHDSGKFCSVAATAPSVADGGGFSVFDETGSTVGWMDLQCENGEIASVDAYCAEIDQIDPEVEDMLDLIRNKIKLE